MMGPLERCCYWEDEYDRLDVVDTSCLTLLGTWNVCGFICKTLKSTKRQPDTTQYRPPTHLCECFETV